MSNKIGTNSLEYIHVSEKLNKIVYSFSAYIASEMDIPSIVVAENSSAGIVTPSTDKVFPLSAYCSIIFGHILAQISILSTPNGSSPVK